MKSNTEVVTTTPSIPLLIVDDDAPQMKALCDTLRDHGFETTGFTSAKAALTALQKVEFHLLLTDLMMPEMDGVALLRAAQAVAPNLVGIVMTGQGTIDSAVEAMKAGALDFILKPFKLSAVIPVLSRTLAVRQLRIENVELTRHLRERTAELEAANKELEAFSDSVSHDLRAPLRAIDGLSSILLRTYSEQIPSEARDLLNRVIAATRRMRQLLEDLLNFSRLGRQPLSHKTVKLANLVQRGLDHLHTECEGRDVEVRVGQLPDCKGDPSLLEQVFVNLLSNALKFTRRREHAIIEVGCDEQPAELICFVRDNGAGFNMQYAERLFGVFQRLHRVEEFEGTGVGLSIVQRIILRHGGRIWAEAEVDKGATFFFTLPLNSAK
jgi:two-component system, sensor histidine kinase and response regulator